jgi:hypothetical protein
MRRVRCGPAVNSSWIRRLQLEPARLAPERAHDVAPQMLRVGPEDVLHGRRRRQPRSVRELEIELPRPPPRITDQEPHHGAVAVLLRDQVRDVVELAAQPQAGRDLDAAGDPVGRPVQNLQRIQADGPPT